MLSAIRKNYPIFVLLVVVFILALTNYTLNTWLSGWDNLHPEFNFEVNIKRSLFAVWQEYQGLGLLGGMGHASDLIRQIFLWLLSFILPLNTLRYFWTFLMLFLGSVGAYYLTYNILKILNNRLNAKHYQPCAFFGGIFYTLNLATLQTFYTPFEAFIAHFAFLPWLLLATVLFFRKQTKTSIVLLFIIFLLSTPVAYISTLFVVFLIATVIVLAPLILSRIHTNEFPNILRTGAKFYMLIFLANAFWLLPFLYFTFTNANVNVNAKINQMATETIFLQNKEFGNLTDTMLLKGFWFNNVDPNGDGNFTYMLQPWRAHLENPIIPAIGYLFFSIIIIGIIQAIRSKKPLLLGFFTLFLFSFTMLSTNTPPFSWFDVLFRKIPLFDQAFRFPFTKFSILAALSYSIFFAIGMQSITARLSEKKQLFFLSYLLPILLLVIFALPAFRGHLFYEKERIVIPKEYFALFDFFKKQGPSTRIANFPQHTFWGWNFYRWGYGGSGFLWYGIKQPILDRAFDVWSKENENYYFEVSHALYSKNPSIFETVLNKYQITWLLIDKNVINPSSPKSLFFSELKGLIKQITTIEKAATFGNIEVYKIALKDNPKSFVSLLDNLSTVNAYNFGESDQAFIDYGSYISTSHPQIFYPFRSLFTNKLQKDIEFSLKEGYDHITFSTTLPKREKQAMLAIPSLLKEELIPVDIVVRKEGNRTLLIMRIETPKILIDSQRTWEKSVEKTLFVTPPKARYPLQLDVNSLATYTIRDEDSYIQRTFISSKVDNVFILKDALGSIIQSQIFKAASLKSLTELQEASISLPPSKNPQSLTVNIPKISDGYIGTTIKPESFPKAKNCDNFRTGEFSSKINNGILVLEAKNATACISFSLPTLLQKQGYALFVPNKNIRGRPLHFWVLNDAQEFSPIDTYFSKEKSLNTFILAPQDDFGKGYSIHLDNVSIGTDESINTVGEISFYPIPYRFLTALKLHGSRSSQESTTTPLMVKQPNESLYIVDVDSKTKAKQPILFLSQSFNHGWRAYRVSGSNFFTSVFPFLFGQELKDHVLVNNWANGWVIPDNYTLDANRYTLVIIFLPQYLQYLGFILLFGTFGWILIPFIAALLKKILWPDLHKNPLTQKG